MTLTTATTKQVVLLLPYNADIQGMKPFLCMSEFVSKPNIKQLNSQKT